MSKKIALIAIGAASCLTVLVVFILMISDHANDNPDNSSNHSMNSESNSRDSQDNVEVVISEAIQDNLNTSSKLSVNSKQNMSLKSTMSSNHKTELSDSIEIDFTRMAFLPHGYESDSVNLTDKGISLSKTSKDEESRYGKLISAPYRLNFKPNAIQPHWMCHVVDGNKVFLEVSLSNDGNDWQDWLIIEENTNLENIQSVTVGKLVHDTNFMTGKLIDVESGNSEFIRFRVTLFSENQTSPLFESFKLNYMGTSNADQSAL